MLLVTTTSRTLLFFFGPRSPIQPSSEQSLTPGNFALVLYPQHVMSIHTRLPVDKASSRVLVLNHLSMALAIGSYAFCNLQPRVRAPNPVSRIIKTFARLPTPTNATKGVSSVCEPLPPDRPLWFPGSTPPEWLDGSLPGDYGFDPLGLGSDPELLRWFAQAELMHSRWAMLAVAGILVPECLEKLGFIENFSWYDAGAQQYFTDPVTLFAVQMILMGWVEGRRWADYIKPGCVDIEPKFPNRKNPKPDVGYPGGLWFDFMMWGRGSPEPVMVLRTKEIKNGRLAMLAFMGFWFQAIYTGEGPLENLTAHIADPGHCNIFSVMLCCSFFGFLI